MSRLRWLAVAVRATSGMFALTLALIALQALRSFGSARSHAFSSPHEWVESVMVDAGPVVPIPRGVPEVRNLFAPEAPPPPAEPETAPPPPPEIFETRLGIDLLGITWTPGGEGARALIREPDGNARQVGVDWIIADGEAVVEKIERCRVVISVGERFEAITFAAPERGTPEVAMRPDPEPNDTDQKDGVVRLTARAPEPPPTEPVRPPPPVDPVLRVAQKVRDMVTFETVRADSGAPAGLSITAVTESSLAANLGFAAGDRILSVNGAPIRGDGLSPSLLRSLQAGGDPVVAIERRDGTTQAITVPTAALLALD